jgi:hypothetical protein
MECEAAHLKLHGGPKMLVAHAWGSAESECVQILRSEVPVSDSDEIVIFWDGETAVATQWMAFLRNWSDFYYPSDDSGVILLPDRVKAVVYIEDKFYYYYGG